MTKFLSVLMILVCVVVSIPALADEVIVGFPSTGATMVDAGDGMVALEATGFATTASPGDPGLPFKTVWVLLPPNADVKSIQVALRNQTEAELPGSYDVAPCAPVASDGDDGPVISWGLDKEIINGKNILTYQTDAFYPAAYTTLGFDSRLGEYLMVPVQCWPYRYNPVTGKLVQLTGGDIVVSYSTTKSFTPLTSAGGAAAAETLSGFVANYEDAPAWYGAPDLSRGPLQAGTPKLVIVTTSAIQSASTKLSAFVNHKTNTMGIPTTVYTESTWGGAGLSGMTAVNAMRDWLKTVYNSSYKWYLLIIADPRQTSLIPMPLIAGGGLYSDHYYADTTGDWDLNDDGTLAGAVVDFGSGGVDVANPEFSVGRIPYYGSTTDLDKILQKTITFETNTSIGAWAQRMLIPMVPANSSVTFSWQVGEGIRTDTANPSYRAYHRQYSDYSFPDTGDPFANPPPTDYGVIMPMPERVPVSESNVLSEWQNGYGFVFWFTHGGPQGASGVFYSSLCQYLPDSKPSFTFQASCSNGDPTDPNNLGYSLLKNGAISTCSASVVSLYRVSGTDGTNDPCNQGMVHHYANYLARQKERCGDAFFHMKSYLSNYWGGDYSMYHNLMNFNMYGDPTVAPLVPTSFTMETAASLPVAVRGQYYRTDLKAAGSATPYVWSRTSGSLPSGIWLSSSGYLYGTPTISGDYTFTLQARSSSSPVETVSREFTLAVRNTLTVGPTSIPRANVGDFYSVLLPGSGGTAPYAYSVGGVLPAGLALSPTTGLLSGTPTTAGTFAVNVMVTDGAHYRAVRKYTLPITYTRILANALPVARGGESYQATLVADSGTAPYTWSLYSGQIPPGLSLSTTGSISGTPRELGVFAFTARVSDSTGEWTTREFTLPVLVDAYNFPLDESPGWDTRGAWAFGVPQGNGSLSHDPTSGHTGANVYGYNLFGDYSNSMTAASYLTTTALDCSDLKCTTLSFWRWLGVEGANDRATIEASPSGSTWSVVWNSQSEPTTIAETEWSLQVYDLSASCDLAPNACVRWGIGPTSPVNRYCGWNIDDVEILGAPSPVVSAGDLGLIKSTSADGAACLVRGKVVSAVFSDCFYIQEPGKYQGLRVVWPYGGISVNTCILVHGLMQTDAASGERYLAADYIYKDTTQQSLRPIGMTLPSLGGSAYGLQQGVTNGAWVTDDSGTQVLAFRPATGVNNIGCLVRVSGKVTKVGSGYFYIDDGSGLMDGTGVANVGVRVQGSLSSSDVGKQAVVTGIITGFFMGDDIMRLIRPTQVYLISP